MNILIGYASPAQYYSFFTILQILDGFTIALLAQLFHPEQQSNLQTTLGHRV